MLATFFTWEAANTTAMLTNVTNLFADSALLIYIAAGVPLGFYVIRRILRILPK